MKTRHLDIRVKQLLALSEASPCPRRRFAAMLVDPAHNVVISDGRNGGPRGGSRLCGGEDICDRDRLNIPSGQRLEIGCHHSEANALMNAARRGAATEGAWIIVTGEPCLMCAKLIHHGGVARVVCVKGGYAGAGAGIDYLKTNGVEVAYVEGPRDPRLGGEGGA